MAGDDRYNGWANRSTWLVNVWFNPETRADLESIKDQIDCVQKALTDTYGGFFADLLSSDIDWDELASQIPNHDDDEIYLEEVE
jgi:hypothetical protein